MISHTRPTPALSAPRRRGGFTLIELMVVITIVFVLMTIVVAATSIGGQILGDARGKGKLMDQQRVAMNTLARDLQFKMFLEDGRPNGREKLSDHRTDKAFGYQDPPPPAPVPPAVYKWTGYKPPRGGYFSAFSPGVDGASNFYEGADSDGFASTRSTNHSVAFTIIVPGGAPQDRLTADVPFLNTPATNSYPITFQAAEVAYFLVPTGTTAGGVKLFNLIRRQRCCAMNQYDAAEYAALLNKIPTGPPAAAPYMDRTDPPQVIAAVDTTPLPASAATYKVFSMEELTLASNRFGSATTVPFAPITTLRVGDDVLLTNVISFELFYKGSGSSATGTWPRTAANGNPRYPYDVLPFDGRYDTFNALQGDWTDGKYLAGSTSGTASSPVKPLRITGVQVNIRCWDPKTKGSRQTSKEISL